MTGSALERLGTQIDEVFFLIGVAILLIELVENWFKGSLRWRTFGDMIASASTQIPFLLIEVLVLTGAYGLYFLVSEALVTWTMPITVWSVLLAVLVADLVYYWEHRLAHEIRILWLQHAVHHSSRYLNIITGIRFGPLEGVWSVIAHFPMVLIGFPPELIIFSSLVVLAYQTWLHTELIGKLGPFEWVLNTPSHHRVHHGSDAKYLDRNYGGILIVWDRLFKTFQIEEETPTYGLTHDFDSVNPLSIWFSEVPQYWRDVRKAANWHDVWMRTFAGPGWKPGSRGATKGPVKLNVDALEVGSDTRSNYKTAIDHPLRATAKRGCATGAQPPCLSSPAYQMAPWVRPAGGLDSRLASPIERMIGQLFSAPRTKPGMSFSQRSWTFLFRFR